MRRIHSAKLWYVARAVARDLRKKQTPAEVILWTALRNRRFLGVKFLRQYQILVEYRDRKTFFVADFYCAESKLIVEVDGGIHERQREKDAERDALLLEYGYRVLRLKNAEVELDLETALKRIASEFVRSAPQLRCVTMEEK